MTIVSLIMVLAGFLGAGFTGQSWLMAMVFLGLFGPFMLRELGILRWRDDFQREAVMRSGMHALVAVGLVLTIILATIEPSTSIAGTTGDQDRSFPLTVVFTVLAVTWGLSWLLQFWGARTGSFRILLWTLATVTVVSLVGIITMATGGRSMGGHGLWTGGLQLLIGWILVLLSRRWPRVTGLLLIGVVGWVVWVMSHGLLEQGGDVIITVLTVAVLPFLVPAIALLLSRDEESDLGRA